MSDPRVQRVLISVSDKTGLVEFVRRLADVGVEIYSTGGTRKHLEAAGFPVIDVAAYTGFPEMMDGRVKTLHPKIFGGVLARRDQEEDLHSLAAHGMVLFDLVVVNLYPFAQTVAKPGVKLDEAVEQIDIGGPSLIRAAAKNHAFTAVSCEPAQYAEIADQVAAGGTTTLALRRRLAAAALAHTARYDAAIAAYLEQQFSAPAPEAEAAAAPVFPPVYAPRWERLQQLRYGENPHQAAALYRSVEEPPHGWAAAKQLSGKELSYNNLLDLDSALAIVRGLDRPACAVVKHNNPCGAAVADALSQAFHLAYEGDPVSAFGSVISFNRPVDFGTAEALSEPGRFVEAIVAPSFDPAALEILKTKPKWRNSVRLLEFGSLDRPVAGWEMRRLDGATLVQTTDLAPDDVSTWKVVTESSPTASERIDLEFAWHLVRFVKSNAIVLVKDGQLLGAGAGQMSRVDSVRIALSKGGAKAAGGALGSDAFFPFPDSIDLAAAAGVRAAIQPGGSKQDPSVIEACNRLGLAMIFTGVRHFRH